MDNGTFCAWCLRVASGGEGTLVKQDGRPSLCGRCIAHAVIALYDGGVNLGTLETGLPELFVVSGERERAMRAEVLDDLRAQYQREFLELREPSETSPNEHEKVDVNLTVNRYTYERMRALAREARVPLSQWIRQAIFLAFKMTSHKQNTG